MKGPEKLMIRGRPSSTLNIYVTISVVKFLLSCMIIPCRRNVIILLVILIFLFFVGLGWNLIGTTGLLDHPVEDVIILVPAFVKEIFEKFAEVAYVGLLLEFHGAAVVQIVADFLGQILAELINLGGQLLVFDFFILLLFRARWNTLPRQLALDEIQKHIAKRLEVVSPGLLHAQVSVDRCVSRGSRQILAISVRDMLTRFGLSKSFGEPKVDDIDIMLFFPNPYEEVVRLDISVQEMARMYKLYPLKHLIGQHQHGLQTELPLAIVEQIFQRRAQKIDYHDIVVTFDPKPMHIWHADSSLQYPVKFGLV